MKLVPKMPVPWDMVVFLTITSVGFGFSVHRLVGSPERTISAAREISSVSSVEPTKQHLVDLGCLERRLGGERWSTARDFVRLRGRFCNISRRAMRGFQGMRVMNLSTGSEGTAFLQSRDPAFVTDDVALQKGRNIIQIEWRESATNASKSWTAEIYQD